MIVTGGTDGIGKETAKKLAELNARVIITGRSEQKALNFISNLPKAQGSNVTFKKVDFSDLENVKIFSEELLKNEAKIDILINNAGLSMPVHQKTAQGAEFTIGVNHIAPVYLTSKLLPLLKKAEKARIINVASNAHYKCSPDYNDFLQLNTKGEDYKWMTTYSSSKLANILFTK